MGNTPDFCSPFAAALGNSLFARRCITNGPTNAGRTLAALAATPLLAAAIEAEAC